MAFWASAADQLFEARIAMSNQPWLCPGGPHYHWKQRSLRQRSWPACGCESRPSNWAVDDGNRPPQRRREAGLEAEEDEQTSRNESEPHPMSLESSTTGEPSPSSLGQGRRESSGQQPASVQRSGGVCVDSASGRPVRVNWEDSGVGNPEFQPAAQAGSAREAAGGAGEVGVPHSSVDLHHFKRCQEPRGDTYSRRRGGAEDAGMAGATQLRTPDKARSLQIALYRKADE